MIGRILVVLLLLCGSVEATERFADNNGNTTGTCTSSSPGVNGPCTLQRALGLTTAPDDIVTMLSNTYQGAANMLRIDSFAAGVSGTSGHPIIVRAQTDGGVFIDGQSARIPFKIDGQNYWTFQGFDVGNGGGTQEYVMEINLVSNSTGLVFQRVIAYTASCASSCNGSNGNVHVWSYFAGCTNCLFEDIAGFGYGRDIFLEGGSRDGTIFRRAWFRWEAIDPAQGAVSPIQSCYNCSGAATFENIITVWNPNPTFTPVIDTNRAPSFLQRDPESGGGSTKYRGIIGYGVASTGSTLGDAWVYFNGTWPGVSIVDLFIDARSQDVASGGFSTGSGGTVDRWTVIKTSGQASSSTSFTSTNPNECTVVGSCPNFYTGDTPGTGARNCLRYSGGTLTSTKLWPWPMDDRIKAAITRAGATALLGTAMSGAYAAGTVTSEIVNKFGTIPSACLTSSSFTPAFPVASDFPSLPVVDSFTRANSGTLGANWTKTLGNDFSIVSNAAAADAVFGRETYSANQITASFHEVYATWNTIQACCGYNTILSFAGTDLTENNQYRVRLNRQSGGNTLMKVEKIDGSGNVSATPITDTDLGIDIVDTNSFGVRVSGTTINVYWKWTDGVWYRIGQVTDATLPTGNVYGGIAGTSPVVIDDFGAGPAPTTPPTPPNPAAVTGSGVGRFGTTFPGVR